MNSPAIIITGGGSGIGSATAEILARRGNSICVADINLEAAKETVARIENAGGVAIATCVDVADPADNQRMVEETLAQLGDIGGLFLNAAMQGGGTTIRDGSLDAWKKTLDVNLTAAYIGMQAAAPHLKSGASIVITASAAGLRGGAGAAAYFASKHGVIGLMKAAAAEFAPDGIRVNAICPGFIETPFLGEHPPEIMERMFENRAPLRRTAKPEEVGELAAFLLSDKSRFITAQPYSIDGGMTQVMAEGESFPRNREAAGNIPQAEG